MEAFDTNVAVRLLVRDDEEQYQRAALRFGKQLQAREYGSPSVVRAEVAWVLRVAYEFDCATAAAALRRLIATDGVHVEDQAVTGLISPPSRPYLPIFPTTSSWSPARQAGARPFTLSTNA